MSDDLVLLLHLAGIVVLLVISAYFAGSETALTAASRARMHQLETHGLERAGIVNRLREQKERLIGALLLGNTLVNILASSLATSLLVSLLGAPAVPVATLVMTVLILVFAEVLPKTYAISHADRAALSVAPSVRGVVRLLGPVVRLVNWLVRGPTRTGSGWPIMSTSCAAPSSCIAAARPRWRRSGRCCARSSTSATSMSPRS